MASITLRAVNGNNSVQATATVVSDTETLAIGTTLGFTIAVNDADGDVVFAAATTTYTSTKELTLYNLIAAWAEAASLLDPSFNAYATENSKFEGRLNVESPVAGNTVVVSTPVFVPA